MTLSEVLALCGFLLTILMMAAGCLIWFVRLEGKVNTLNALHEQFKGWVEKEHSSLAKQFDDGLRDVKVSIDRIFDRLENKQDKP